MKSGLSRYLVLFACWLFALGCSDDPESGKPQTDAESGADSQSDSQSDASGVEVEDPCAPTLQSWDFEQTMPEIDPYEIGTRQRKGSMQVSAASLETVGARVRSGVLTIEINEPEEEFGSISLTVNVLPKTSGALPSRHELVEPQEGNTGGSEGYLTTHILGGNSLGIGAGGLLRSTQLMPSVAGHIQFDTCPNEVGQMAIGRFEQSQLTLSGDASILNGDFSVVVVESDGSLSCGPPTVCSY